MASIVVDTTELSIGRIMLVSGPYAIAQSEYDPAASLNEPKTSP